MRFAKLFVAIGFVSISLAVQAQTDKTPSARRPPGVSGEQMMREFEETYGSRGIFRRHHDDEDKTEDQDQNEYTSAYGARVALEDLDTSKLPEVSAEELEQIFKNGRDHRPLEDRHSRKRRPTWLYPDDGCFARAELMVNEAKRTGATLPHKVFVFGELNAMSANSPTGWVSWWYHVAPVIKSGGVVYVLDPALRATEPMTLEGWVKKTTDPQAKVSLCLPSTYDPSGLCFKAEDDFFNRALRDELFFLDPEWSRVKYLGRNPEDELGDYPPWLNYKF